MIDIQDIVRTHGPEAALELLLLRQKVSGDSDVSVLKDFLSVHELQLTRFVHRLAVHQLAALLLPLLPEEIRSKPEMVQLKQRTEGRARYNLLLLSEMLRLQALCRANSLDIIFTKGLLLSKMLYGDFTSRPASDVDILVRMEDFMPIRALLLADGYREHYPFPETEQAYFLQYHREAAFSKSLGDGVNLHVELQWSVLPAYFPMPYGNDYFFQHTVDAAVGEASITTLAPTQHFLLLLAHHGMGDLWRNLRHLADIAQFFTCMKERIDWAEVEARVQQWNIRTASACGFALVDALVLSLDHKLVRREIPASLLRRCVHHVLNVPMLSKHRTHYETLAQQLSMCDSGSDRLALLRGLVKRYCSPGMEELALVRLPRMLFPAYLVIRQFRFLYADKHTASAKQFTVHGQ
jgi:hypothetical protein